MVVKIRNPILRGVTSVLVSFFVSLGLVILVGIVIPILIMRISIGAHAVQEAPGHGSAILFLTVPIAAVVCFIFLFGFVAYFYEKFR